ncbi:Hypothetical protein A7982_05936 [Minicystis rosea]|nr:Hypothetical protein A7982_05936 [Minicystis rosea]
MSPGSPAAPAASPAAPPAAPRTPEEIARRARLRKMAIIGVLLSIMLVLLAAHSLLVAAYLRYRAARLGFELSFDDYVIQDNVVRLEKARAKLAGVRGLRVDATRVKLRLRGSEVASIEAADVSVALEGSATDRVLEVAAWSGDHPEAFRLSGSASDVRVAWRAAAGADPWLAVTGGTLTTDGKTAHFAAKATSAGGVPLGQVSAGFAVESSGVTIELGKGANEEAPIKARLSTSSKPPRVEITLQPVRLSTLGAALGLALPAPGAVASGKAELSLGRRAGAESITGSAQILLDGWVPPHPRELSGVITGKKTSIASKIGVAEDRSKVSLSDILVRAGKLDLKGSGTIARAGDHATMRLDLAGPIPCADLARSVAKERLGLLGELAGDAASGAVSGSVSINVAVEADSRDLRNAKVTPKVGVGCGLKMPF